MEPADFVGYLRVDAPAVLAAGKRAPTAPVPSCPEWNAEALVGHLGSAYWWVEAMVRERATEMGAFTERPEGWDALCTWYDDGLAAILAVFEAVGPDEPVWNWSVMGPGPARFWHRRVAHEASVHRWDIEQAVGIHNAIDGPIAADGIDEYVGLVPFWVALSPRPELKGTLGLEATDADVAYTMVLAPDSVVSRPGLHNPDAVVRATTSDLLLWLLGRRHDAGEAVAIEGDASVARAWSSVTFG